MEATAMSLGKAVLGGALSYAKSKAAEEVALQLGVEDDVVFITDELQMMQSFLMTADEERSQSQVLTTWVTQVRDLAYNVEDSLMDFGIHTGKKPIWGCIPHKLCDRRRIAKEVKKLRAKVEDVSNRNLRYRLIKDGSSSKHASAAEQAASDGAAMSSGVNQAMFSFVEQKKSRVDLLQLITSKEVDLRVMAVWGTTGDPGKTVAIHEIYDDPRLASVYGIRAWVKLVNPFNPKEFIHSMVRQFFENNLHEKLQGGEEVTNVGASVLLKMEKMNESDLVHTFTAQLSCNSYLIVINDLHTIEEWQCIKTYFPDNKKQSRIIVSTQQVEVASLCTEQPYQMSQLKQRPCGQTLYVFHKENSEGQTNTASVSSVEKNEAKPPADLGEGKSNLGHLRSINIENPKKVAQDTTQSYNTTMVIPLSVHEPISDPATPSSELQEEYQKPNSTSGGNNFSTSIAMPSKKFDRTSSTVTPRKKFDRTRTIMALDDDVLVGRNKEKSKVINLIGKPTDSQGRKVISISGMGGLGKTTLVRSIYRSEQLAGWKRAWVPPLRPFNREVLIRTLVLQLLTDDPTDQERTSLTTMRLNDLTKSLVELLEKHNHCLIVLDDLSSTDDWNLIRDQLANAKRIIVTTRENSVARYCSGGNKNTHQLQDLQQDDALALFEKKVFKDYDKDREYHLGPDMLAEEALIIKKCHGLPLAISTIGGFLATKPKTAIEWKKVNDHIRVELDINPELRSMKTVLMRSYDGLPYHLKSAFLYMSIFPGGYKIKRKRLIRRWIAEGYCREMHGMTADEVGDRYFDELLDRCMILLWEGAIQYGGAIDSCQLHDLIREICILKAREENHSFTLEEGCCLSDAQGAIRHLVIGRNWKRDKDVLQSMVDLSHVRSLTVFGDWKSFFISDKMRFLRVLDLGDTLGLRDHHLDQIGHLFHLRYLSLRGCCNIFCLPSSMGNLTHLQTLDGRDTKITRFPSTFTKLRKLEHLLASDDDLEGRQQGQENDIMEQLRENEGSSCFCSAVFYRSDRSVIPDMKDHLIDYPIRKNNCCTSLLYHIRMFVKQTLFCLSVCCFCWRPRALDESLNRRDVFNIQSAFDRLIYGGVEAPRGMRKLKALQTLGVVNVARSKTTLKELEELTQLRKLGVAGVYGKYSKRFWSAISGHKQLRSLSVKGHGLDSCLVGGLLPPTNLESLKLEGELVKVTEWMHKLHNLLKLQLKHSHLKFDSADPIEAIGQLPNLKVLDLRSDVFTVTELLFQGPSFPSLMVLELRGEGYKLVSFREHTMPKLELIHSDSYRLLELRGLPFLTSLKEIRLGNRTDDKLKTNLKSQVSQLNSKEYQKQVSLKLL